VAELAVLKTRQEATVVAVVALASTRPACFLLRLLAQAKRSLSVLVAP